jgi:hypothetical protein
MRIGIPDFSQVLMKEWNGRFPDADNRNVVGLYEGDLQAGKQAIKMSRRHPA